MRPFLFFGAVLATMTGVFAGEQRLSSGETRVSLLELYTSEGCSSCPPAERWLGTLREAPGLWHDFVPIAFHVNYWDQLGWPDRFATREFTQREQAYAAAWGSASVYTPCFVRDGVEWRADSRPPAASSEKAGVLTLILAGDHGRVEFTPPSPRAKQTLELHLALLGGGLASRVTAGENHGSTLRHEFVALTLETHALALTSEGAYRADFLLPHSKITDVSRQALAVWITRQGELIPLQAAGGWIAP